MKPIVGQCNYDLNGYSHRQFWRLVRDLTAFGWTVVIRANEDRRPPWMRPDSDNAYECFVRNIGYGCYGDTRRARTPWKALTLAVVEIVNVYEDGTAAIGYDPALSMARQFHDTYERLAPSYGYKTRPETMVFNPDTPNGRLMIQTCREIMHRVAEMADAPRPQAPASGQPEHGACADRCGSATER